MNINKNYRFFSTLSIFFVLTYVVLFSSCILTGIGQYNIWAEFLLSVFLSVGGFILSILSILGNRKYATSYFVALFSFLLILFIVFVYLLPEGGLPPAIPLFFN